MVKKRPKQQVLMGQNILYLNFTHSLIPLLLPHNKQAIALFADYTHSRSIRILILYRVCHNSHIQVLQSCG